MRKRISSSSLTFFERQLHQRKLSSLKIDRNQECQVAKVPTQRQQRQIRPIQTYSECKINDNFKQLLSESLSSESVHPTPLD